ncbi:hypothetical protein ACJRO7_020398 [Eucalyptus globulus]|uniref:PGG domain-containing protein n=1 Tax=Eucalyptus globulus TaxID=34317 RepID=A0ABD3KMN2_EUCGL
MANHPESPMKLIKVLLNHHGRDSPTEVHNVLLVVATLIAAVTFQTGVTSPQNTRGGIWLPVLPRGHGGHCVDGCHSQLAGTVAGQLFTSFVPFLLRTLVQMGKYYVWAMSEGTSSCRRCSLLSIN